MKPKGGCGSLTGTLQREIQNLVNFRKETERRKRAPSGEQEQPHGAGHVEKKPAAPETLSVPGEEAETAACPEAAERLQPPLAAIPLAAPSKFRMLSPRLVINAASVENGIHIPWF